MITPCDISSMCVSAIANHMKATTKQLKANNLCMTIRLADDHFTKKPDPTT